VAVLVSGVNWRRIAIDDGAARAVLYELTQVTTADTMDVGAEFRAVKQAAMVGATVEGVATAAVAGTVITIPAGLSGDAAYMLAYGDPNYNVSLGGP
jgi:hypothetical protein